MDALSRIIRNSRVVGRVDKRCLFGAAAQVNHENELRRAPFHLVLEGSCSIGFEGDTMTLQAGELVIFPRGSAHFIATHEGPRAAVTETPGVAFNTARTDGPHAVTLDLLCGHFEFGAGTGAQLFATLPEVVRYGIDTERLAAIGGLIRLDADHPGAGTGAILAALCDALLALALRAAPMAGAQPRPWTATQNPDLLRLLDAITCDPAKGWSGESMAKFVGLGRATLHRVCLHELGITPGELLTRVRLLHATHLLEHTNHSVAQVAAESGYGSESAFGKSFKAQTGATPARYRAQIRG